MRPNSEMTELQKSNQETIVVRCQIPSSTLEFLSLKWTRLRKEKEEKDSWKILCKFKEALGT